MANHYSIENNTMKISLLYDEGLYLLDWQHKVSREEKRECEKKEFCRIFIEGTEIPSSAFRLTNVEQHADEEQKLLSISAQADLPEGALFYRFALVSNSDDTMDMYVQLKAAWGNDLQKEVDINLPFLSDFPSVGSANNTFFCPSSPRVRPNGTPLLRLHDELFAPLGIFDEQSEQGFSFHFPVYFPPVQSSNGTIKHISSAQQLKDLTLFIRPSSEWADIVVANITAIQRGWVEYFDQWRTAIRKRYCLKEYTKPETQWYKHTYLHHFTYIYGKEAFNYTANRLDLERLLQQGEEFGGYDLMILWHQYPRLGVDERTQWEFFNDFPGGQEGLKQAVRTLQDAGTRVLLPYKPWDIRSDQSLYAAGQTMAQLVSDTNADGYFLDTMNGLPAACKRAVDEEQRGKVFCSESQPVGRENIESMAGSWDQMFVGFVDTNLLRFVLPEHYAPMISRWVVGMRKDMLIKSAIFNGTGMVIWQDIFGAWLPYSDEQKATIKKWKGILSANHDTFFCARPIPLYPTLVEGVYCNCFPADDGKSVIYCVYNDTGNKVEGNILTHSAPNLTQGMDCWNNSPISIAETEGRCVVCAQLDAGEIGVWRFTED